MATNFLPPVRPFIHARHRGGSQTPKALVLHGTVSSDNVGTARNIANWWAGPGSPLTSAHYVVDPREDIQCVGDHTVAYHCGYNTGSIAIEFCDEEKGPANRWDDADSRAILQRGARLAAELCLAYDIEVRRPTVAELKKKGPHGIYGHNDSRLAFGHTTHRDPLDFPWKRFLAMVRHEIAVIRAAGDPAPQPTPKSVLLSVAQVSMQYSDTDTQMEIDVRRILRRGYQWVTGTEVSSASKLAEILHRVGDEQGYFVLVARDHWIAVRRNFIGGNVVTGYVPVIEHTEGGGHHSDRGIAWVSFEARRNLGRITIGASHYLTHGRKPGDRNYELNQRFGNALRRWVDERGRGSGIVFYGGDQNILDSQQDTFFGAPLTSLWDELGVYENTGHGNIDVIASSNRDGRVKGRYIRAFSDREFFLNTDHFLVEGGYDVTPLKG